MQASDLVALTGQHLLFIGAGDSDDWTIAQFQQAAQFAKAHGVDCLLVKMAEGSIIWRGGLDGWHAIRAAIQAEGVGAIPYVYPYGNKFGDIDAEIDIMISYLQDGGILCADMEDAWNGQVGWAQHLASRLTGVSGLFLCSTWADPSMQDWLGVIQALAQRVDVWMPQQYDNDLAKYWQEFGANGATWLQPSVMMTADFGANDPVAIASAAHSQGHTAISVWHYDLAVANPSLLDAIYAAFPKALVSTEGGNTSMSGVPAGWTDDGTTLTAPTKEQHKVGLGFRKWILEHDWDPANVPLEDEHGANPVEEYFSQVPPDGTRQLFNYSELGYTKVRGVYVVGIGNELRGARADRDQARADLKAAQAQIVQLQQQLTAAKAATPGSSDQINEVTTTLETIMSAAQASLHYLGKA